MSSQFINTVTQLYRLQMIPNARRKTIAQHWLPLIRFTLASFLLSDIHPILIEEKGNHVHIIVLNVFRSCYLNRWFCKFGYISVLVLSTSLVLVSTISWLKIFSATLFSHHLHLVTPATVFTEKTAVGVLRPHRLMPDWGKIQIQYAQ